MFYYGHSKEDPITKEILPKHDWQLLKDHLEHVATMSEKRAAKFGAKQLGRIIGVTHDLGKYSQEFQKRIEGSKKKVDHSTAGAQEVYLKFGSKIGKALAFVIAGHHGGLPDGNKGDPKNLMERLEKKDLPAYQAYKNEITIPDISNKDLLYMPQPTSAAMAAFSFSFCIRMLYSCLVDADYLDTESFMTKEKFSARQEAIQLQTLLCRFQDTLNKLAERNRINASIINNARQAILDRCLTMAESKPGLYTLTVPTGGGKTYSSLAFGLKHAVKHNKDRIIYVIPYTSIIEQNAQVFREALEDNEQNEEVVLEHHSNFEYPEGSFDEWNQNEKAHRLATENWDMPIVVTTAVQFFESLYANKGSRCRKLHNIVNSVIILDEAQMMPLEYMKPCLWALAELVLNYGATVVLCTATQPAIKELIPGGLKATEIMSNPNELQNVFKRVKVTYVHELLDENLAIAMAEKTQVLTIVNTRRHARLLFAKLQEKTTEGIYHLSARMCPMHRKVILAEIRQALINNRPCRVVSTQLIEAGVDVDFPFVYRAMAGIDSIAQAAGRCNREGKQKEGEVFVFEPEKHGMPRQFDAMAGMSRSTIRRLQNFGGDLLSLAAIDDYFNQLIDFEKNKLDAKNILKMLEDAKYDLTFPFATIAQEFQIIDSVTVPVVIPWGEKAKKLIEDIKYHPFPTSMTRNLQPYIVQVYTYELVALERAGGIRKVGEVINLLTDRSFYDDQFGLKDAKDVIVPTDVLMF